MDRLGIKFCEYGGCSILIVEKMLQQRIENNSACFGKVLSFSIIALTS